MTQQERFDQATLPALKNYLIYLERELIKWRSASYRDWFLYNENCGVESEKEYLEHVKAVRQNIKLWSDEIKKREG